MKRNKVPETTRPYKGDAPWAMIVFEQRRLSTDRNQIKVLDARRRRAARKSKTVGGAIIQACEELACLVVHD